MKKIEKTENIEKKIIVYQAVDGTEFDSMTECEKYEKSAACVINTKYNKLIVGTTNEADLLQGNCDNTIDILQPQYDEDINTILQFIAYKCCYNSDNTTLKSYYDIIKGAILSSEYLFVGRNFDDNLAWVIGTCTSIMDNITNIIRKEVKHES